jgi:hypothetical protein
VKTNLFYHTPAAFARRKAAGSAAGRGETFKTIKNFRLSKILFDICLSCGIVISEAVCTADVKVKERI